MIDQLGQIREEIARGNFNNACRLARHALDQLQDEDTRARLTHNLALATHRAGRNHEALSILTDNASLFEHAPLIVRANVHNERGIIFYKLGRDNEARAEYERAARLYEVAGDNPRRASALNNLALCHLRAGRHREAHKRAAESRRLWESAGDRPRVSQALDTLARILLAEGRYKEASRAILRARALLLGTHHSARRHTVEETRRAIQRAQTDKRRVRFNQKPTRALRRTVQPQRARAP
jgi:tetratricopeptide (TPR) repeat protein